MNPFSKRREMEMERGRGIGRLYESESVGGVFPRIRLMRY